MIKDGILKIIDELTGRVLEGKKIWRWITSSIRSKRKNKS